MPDLGLEVLLKGKNMVRLLGGLGVALKISAVSVLISLPLGILLGVLMTFKNPILKTILRVYLEFIRIMPQMVLLFLVYFGTTRAFGWDLSGEMAAVIGTGGRARTEPDTNSARANKAILRAFMVSSFFILCGI